VDIASFIFFPGYCPVSNAIMLCEFSLFISVLINKLFAGKMD